MIMKIMVAFVVLVIIAAIVTVVIVLVKPNIFNKNNDTFDPNKQNNNTNTNQVDTSVYGNTADFIPFKDITENILDLGNYSFRTILECSSINYSLLSETEQNTEDMLFNNCLNSISFPFEIYIQTREIDMNTKMRELSNQTEKTKKKFPQCSAYADNYLLYMKNLTNIIGNTKIKRKYFIISFNSSELKGMSSLSIEEIIEFSKSQLLNRSNIVASCLKACGLNVKLLDKSEICEVMYSYYHRDRYNIAKDIVKGRYDSLVINNKNEKQPNERQILDSILTEVQNRIKTELVTALSTSEEIAYYEYIYKVLDVFRQDDKVSSVAELMEKNYEEVNADTKKEFDTYIKNHLDEIEPKDQTDKVNTYFSEFPDKEQYYNPLDSINQIVYKNH